MGNNYFKFKQFTINQNNDVFRVGTDGVLLGAWTGTEGVRSVLDIGTGTGLIALMLAQRIPDATIVALEPDEESFLCAEANVKKAGADGAITLKRADLISFAQENDTIFELIITNPPYFSDSLRNPDPVKAGFRHSFSLPSSEIISFAVRFLSENGRLSLILPYTEGNVFVAEAALSGLYCIRMTKVRALHNSDPNRLLLEFSRQRKPLSVKILTIGHPAHGGYTAEYKDLTKEFYLNF
jgi:tRNA1Val (adenine37-N6)-methyltransferase